MKHLLSLLFLVISYSLFAQNNRQNDPNNIYWAQLFITKKINAKTDWLVEYQWRRTNGLKDWQQGLLRTAIQYKPNASVALALGYAEAETFPYGDFPIANAGTFPEHRLFEQIILKQTINKLAITNRFRVEQRWLGKVVPGTRRDIESWTYLNRFRYLLKMQYPVSKKMYVWFGDEIFIGAGKNLGVNIFDQNRIHANLGLKISTKTIVELGYLNQVLQQGRIVNSKVIMQRNNGLAAAVYFNL
jgi:hypothetical protein